MDYLFDSPADREAMLRSIGVAEIDRLFDEVPRECRLANPLRLAPALSELELQQHLQGLSERSLHAGNSTSFLGGGSYDHFVPAVVDAIASRGEFYTSYTPYQPEASQGNLQVMFEYQSLICELTGMDVSNASLYDGGSALAEAAILCVNVVRNGNKVVVPTSLHPEYREILSTYLQHMDCELVTVEAGDVLDPGSLADELDDQTACVVIPQPNFFGRLESLQELIEITHRAGALAIVCCDPISLGLLRRPGDLGADVVVAEGQSLGTPPLCGGPYLGILACREAFVRRMPGRIAGQTVDRNGKRCWVLTLQTREQHIRREKATSNICTNQGLLALRAAIYLALVGPRGLRQVATLCTRKAHYAAELLTVCDRFEMVGEAPFFKEFVVRDRANQVPQLLRHAAEQGILAGLHLARWYPMQHDCFLVAVTEQRTREQIDAWAACLANCPRPASAATHSS